MASPFSNLAGACQLDSKDSVPLPDSEKPVTDVYRTFTISDYAFLVSDVGSSSKGSPSITAFWNRWYSQPSGSGATPPSPTLGKSTQTSATATATDVPGSASTAQSCQRAMASSLASDNSAMGSWTKWIFGK